MKGKGGAKINYSDLVPADFVDGIHVDFPETLEYGFAADPITIESLSATDSRDL